MAAVPEMLAEDRQRAGFTVGRAARCIGITPADHREVEAGTRSPDWDAYDQICKLHGWPQTLVGAAGQVR